MRSTIGRLGLVLVGIVLAAFLVEGAVRLSIFHWNAAGHDAVGTHLARVIDR